MDSLCVLFYIILLLGASGSVQAVEFKVLNNATGTAGGIRFQDEMGNLYSEEVLDLASKFIWQTFEQGESDRKHVSEVTLIVESMMGVAYTRSNIIHLNSQYLTGFSGDARIEVIGVIYHESTHVWQWNGNGHAPVGLIEGMADYVRLKANFASSRWVAKGSGDGWDEGYAVTAYFLDYCNDLKNGFVASLNRLMIDSYSDEYFFELLGKSVHELWNDYKHMYGAAL